MHLVSIIDAWGESAAEQSAAIAHAANMGRNSITEQSAAIAHAANMGRNSITEQSAAIAHAANMGRSWVFRESMATTPPAEPSAAQAVVQSPAPIVSTAPVAPVAPSYSNSAIPAPQSATVSHEMLRNNLADLRADIARHDAIAVAICFVITISLMGYAEARLRSRNNA